MQVVILTFVCVCVCGLCALQVRTLSETVRLDARTKLLNPKFYEGMLATGYEGARCVAFAFPTV